MNDKKRVAVIDPSAFTIPYDDHLCRGLVQAGCDVRFFTRPVRKVDYFTRTPKEEADKGYKTLEHFYRRSERFPNHGPFRPLQRGLKVIEHIRGMDSLCCELRNMNPDAIHFQWTVIPAVDKMFVSRLRSIAPCLLTVHDTGAFLAPSSRLQVVGWRSILTSFDRLIVHTQAGKQSLLSKGIEPSRISVIPHGVFGRMPEVDTTSTQADDKRLTLLSFGSVKPYKGIDILIRSLAELPDSQRDKVRLIIAGNANELEKDLRDLAEKLGVNGMIEWRLEFIPDDEIPVLFSQSHAVVFPYREIDASGALMTAIPYGKTIIASRLGLFAELLKEGETAYLVEPKDPSVLAAAIADIVRNSAAARQMGQRAAALAQNVLSWDNIARLTLEAYEAARSH